MGDIINKISFNGTSYDISVPHGISNELQFNTRYHLVTVPSLPTIGQVIAITFNNEMFTSVVVFSDGNETSLPMYITYKNAYIQSFSITPPATYLFVISQSNPDDEFLLLNLIGGFDAFAGSHASESTTYGVGATDTYGHVKTITGDVSKITSYNPGNAAAAYHSHSIYAKTIYLSSVATVEEYDANKDINYVSFQASEALSHELENGDVLIFPMTITHGSFAPDGAGYHSLSGFRITTPSGVRTFLFYNPYKIRFKGSTSDYYLVCVIENDENLTLLNPVDTMMAYQAYSANEAGYSETANRISTTRYIDGLAFNGSANVNHYGVCSVVGSTAIKKVTITGLTAITGAIARVKFSNAHTVTTTTTATRARLVLNNASYSTSNLKGVIRAYSTGYYLPTANSWASNQIVEMIYDGTYWNIISPYITKGGSVSGGGSGSVVS